MTTDYLAEDILDDFGSAQVRVSSEDTAQRVYWISFWANLGLAVLKVAMGAVGYSRLLIIDGLASAANAVVIATLLFGVRIGHRQTISKKYPHGKGKAQFLATLVVGFLLAVGASVILALSVKNYFVPISLEPTGIGLAAAVISIYGNVMLIRYLKQISSANDHPEYREIALLQSLNIVASAVVLQAIGFAGLFGWVVAERIGALSISFIVVWLSIRIIKSSLDGIMDRSSGKKTESRIEALAASVDGVENVRWVRTRRVGQNLSIDLQVGMDGDCTISNADQTAERIRQRLTLEMEKVLDVTVDRYPV